MKPAASNLMLPAFDHARLLPRLTRYGVAGLADHKSGVTGKDVPDYARITAFARPKPGERRPRGRQA